MSGYDLLGLPERPTVIARNHESLYRSYHILNVVEALLEDGAPGHVVSKIVRELRELPQKEAGA